MSLNFELGKIKDWKTVTRVVAEHDAPGQYKAGDEIMNPLTNTLIWATIGIGMGEITEENVHEFYARLRIQEAINGAYQRKAVEGGGWEDKPITLDEVKQHIGLTTNVFPKRSHSEFLKQVVSELARNDGVKVEWTDDYQKLVQWARLLADQTYDENGRFQPQERIINRMAGELPSREKYPLLDAKGATLMECEECGDEHPEKELKDGICAKCEASYQEEIKEGAEA